MNTEVVGESFCQPVLDRVAGGLSEYGANVDVVASLHLINNSHDLKAVSVTVGGELVGHIPRDEAETLRAEMIALSSDLPLTCKAKITGGWNRGSGDTGMFGISLSLSRPLKIAKVG